MDSAQASSQNAPRRSQRERKQIHPIDELGITGKRKRTATDDENEEEHLSDEEEQHEDYVAPKAKTTKRTTRKDPTTKPAKQATRKPRARKAQGNVAFDAEQVAKDTKVNTDNPLFNAILNPSAALQGTAEDFLESFSQDAGAAQAELVNLILRSCGCNESVDADKVQDMDGIQSTVDDLVEALKTETSPTYPLTSKHPMFKKFRTYLSEFLSRVVSAAADLGVLYTTDLIPNLSAWVVTMSSAPLRSFRHTATVVALDVEAALCDVARSVEKESEVMGRQREGEKKRKGKGSAGAKDKELERKMKEVKERDSKISEFIKDFIDGVFINRYRDLDPVIRTECINSLGSFFKKYPSHFLSTSYLRYVGWVLSDADTHVRQAAVKSLQIVYTSSAAQDLSASLNHFTERFRPRLVEMAEADVDISVRVGVLNVLEEIEKTGMLGEEERERLGSLVFCNEPRVRKAVGGFVRKVWEEWVEDRDVEMGGKDKGDKERMGIKGIAALLEKWGQALDEASGHADDDDISEEKGQRSTAEIASLAAASRNKATNEGRTALATDALWEELDAVTDWNGILDILLLDHSAANDSQATSSPSKRGQRSRAVGKASADDDDDDMESVSVDDSWRLKETEEGILLELLVASINHTKRDAAAAKKGDVDAVINEVTRALMKGLPRLFVKYQSDENRIKDVLILPQLVNLDLYLEMRALSEYGALWDDVLKQFLSHSSPTILTLSMSTIMHLMSATALSNTNSTKILELEDELSTMLRDGVSGRDEIETATFSEDEILALGATCMRLKILAGTRDLTAWMEENEGGKQSSAWELVAAIAERGRMGYSEETMVEQALHLLTLHIMWKGKGLATHPDDPEYRETLKTQRAVLLEKLVEFAVGTQSNTMDGVKRAAFKNLLDLHVLFSAAHILSPDDAGSIALTMEDEVQYRCAGYIQAEIERYAEIVDDGEDNKGEDDSDEDSDTGVKAKKPKKKHAEDGSEHKSDEESRARLEKEYAFIDVVTTFLRAIRAGAVHVRHSAVILSHYGRLGGSFNQCTKVILEVLREEGMYNDDGDTVVLVMTQAMQEAFTLVIDSVVRDEENAVQLAKQLSTCFLIRGTQLAVVRRLDVRFVVQIHTMLVSWLAKRLTTYNASSNKGALRRTLTCFRALAQMLAVVQTREALSVKAHLDQVLAQGKVEIGSNVVWEPLRAYERKLMSKDKENKAPATKRKTKGKGKGKGAATDEESEVEALVGETSEGEAPAPRPPPTRQRPKRAASNRTRAAVAAAQTDDEEPEPTTPKPRPRARPTYKSKGKSPVKPLVVNEQEDQESEDEEAAAGASQAPVSSPEASPQATPRRPPKRPRDGDEDEGEEERNSGLIPEANEPPTPEAGYMQVRRKRARH